MKGSFRATVYEALGTEPNSGIGKAVSIFLTTLIVLNIAALVVETVEGIHRVAPRAFWTFEAVSVGIFTVEYLLRLWSCTADPRFSRPVADRLKFTVSPLALIDLLAILPFYATLLNLFGLDLRVLRAARLVGRAARLGHYSSGLRTLTLVLQAKRNELLTVIVVLLFLLLLASSLMFYAENGTQPDKFSSIPDTMWWGIITLTTVGYGDAYPVTMVGRTLAGLMAVMGIGLFALPAGILGSGFMEALKERGGPAGICPHCGR